MSTFIISYHTVHYKKTFSFHHNNLVQNFRELLENLNKEEIDEDDITTFKAKVIIICNNFFFKVLVLKEFKLRPLIWSSLQGARNYQIVTIHLSNLTNIRFCTAGIELGERYGGHVWYWTRLSTHSNNNTIYAQYDIPCSCNDDETWKSETIQWPRYFFRF